MPTTTIDGHEIHVDNEGFLTDYAEWSEDLAKSLFALFPQKPAKKMAYIAGLPKPRGCV